MKNKLFKKGIVIGIIVLFVGTSAVPSTTEMEFRYYSQPDTVYVDDDYNETTPGWGYDHFDSIQDGIDAVNESGTVYVYNGTYYENVDINKDSINLVSENKNNTIIDGSTNTNNGITIQNHDNVTVSGFIIRNVPYHPSQPSLYSNGIHIWATSSGSRHSNYNIVTNCIINNCSYHGIRIHASDNGQNVLNNLISNCEIFNNSKCGLMIASDQNSESNWSNASYNRINNCSIHNNRGQGIKFGHEGETSFNSISDCVIYNNLENGIFILSVGALYPFTHNNSIIYCDIFGNRGYGINITSSYGGSSNNNKFYHNNFLNDTNNAADECNNAWDNGYPSGGNYWSDYWGDDLYSGPNQDIPGPDGIGDIPYEIPCEHGIDYYPLMNPFEQYYILNISAPPEVDEGELFNVVVTSIGGPVVPDVAVGFNDELKLTDSDGRVYFTAPQVGEDTFYEITAIKEGYTSDNESILVKDKLIFFNYAFILGRLDNLITEEEIITFEAVNIRAITFFPFTYNHYKSRELITISKYYFGLVGARFIAAFCGLSYRPSIISMNILSWDNISNKVVWLVSGVEGNPIGINDVETILINEAGQPQPDAEITFKDTTETGRISPGDTFTVVDPSDGNYGILYHFLRINRYKRRGI